jgi:hypothetical protein
MTVPLAPRRLKPSTTTTSGLPLSRISGNDGSVQTKVSIFLVFFVIVVYFSVSTNVPVNHMSTGTTNRTEKYDDSRTSVKDVAQQFTTTIQASLLRQRAQFSQALQSLSEHNLPPRLRTLRDLHQVVGEKLVDIKFGKETVHEILQGAAGAATIPKMIMSNSTTNNSTEALSLAEMKEPPMTLPEIIAYLDNWIHTLHGKLGHAKHATFEGIWQVYHDLAVKTLYPWDREYLRRMPPRRDDGSIFLSVATYRDENCFNVRHSHALDALPQFLVLIV